MTLIVRNFAKIDLRSSGCRKTSNMMPFNRYPPPRNRILTSSHVALKTPTFAFCR